MSVQPLDNWDQIPRNNFYDRIGYDLKVPARNLNEEVLRYWKHRADTGHCWSDMVPGEMWVNFTQPPPPEPAPEYWPESEH